MYEPNGNLFDQQSKMNQSHSTIVHVPLNYSIQANDFLKVHAHTQQTGTQTGNGGPVRHDRQTE